MDIKPVHDRVLIKPIIPENKTAGGLLIPDNTKDAPTTGLVINVGPGRTTKLGNIIPMVVSEGNKVMYPTGLGNPVTIGDQEYIILNENQILAIVE
tara:strand:+ start:117 stop:404 length:288 start_codon:yes stop_codon:yes gene_type:complete